MTTPSPAPQQWADKAADEIFAIHVETGLTGRCEDVAAIITKHAAAISEENNRLRRELEREERAHGITITQRDEAEAAADDLASAVLGEPIDWSDHAAKWKEAVEKLG